MLKRGLDIVAASVGLCLLSPLLALIALAVKLGTPGPVLFRQRRLTGGGRVFTMLKFRTMVQNAEALGTGLFNYSNDPRVTRVGALLRRTSLDELPQLLNVLKGDMSLVGPRPPVTYELGRFEDLNEEYRMRFRVQAGITGLAQVSGRNELPWDVRILHDNRYVELYAKWGLLLDLKILFLTVLRVFAARDICEPRGGGAGGGLSDEELARQAQQAVVQKATTRR